MTKHTLTNKELKHYASVLRGLAEHDIDKINTRDFDYEHIKDIKDDLIFIAERFENIVK